MWRTWSPTLVLTLPFLFPAAADHTDHSDHRNGNACDQNHPERKQHFDVPLGFKRKDRSKRTFGPRHVDVKIKPLHLLQQFADFLGPLDFAFAKNGQHLKVIHTNVDCCHVYLHFGEYVHGYSTQNCGGSHHDWKKPRIYWTWLTHAVQTKVGAGVALSTPRRKATTVRQFIVQVRARFVLHE